MTTTDDPLDKLDLTTDQILEAVEEITGEIRETEGHLYELRKNRLRWYRQGQRRGVSLRQLGEAAGCSGEAVSAALKRAEAHGA